ncbi:MAG: DUF3048 domain-containing protein [Patescibacteria group bacterium]|nr:DUF3048 domain-containing protein [Patescibacteria group bacterium]
MNKKIIFFVLLLGFYFLSTGISYAIFSFINKPSTVVLETPVSSGDKKEDNKHFPLITGPKDQVCPLNGASFTKMEKDLWDQRRPLLVMIENHEESRPQSGLSKADIVYEAVAEGAITRFMAVFYCADAAYAVKDEYDVGPVRSARTYFLDWASEYADYPLYAHVGGAGQCSDPTVDPRAKALCQIEKYGWKNKETRADLDQFALGFKVCRREPDRLGHEVATEHSMYCSTESLWQTAVTRKLTNVNYKNVAWDKNFRSWLFKEDAPSSGSVSPEFDFWRDYKAYSVRWEYDNATNSYKRFNGGVPHLDFNTNEQLMTKNVVIQFAEEKGPVDEHKHLIYGTTGTGKALVFQDGLVVEGKWAKKSRTDRTLFYDNKGKEIKFNRGQVWIEILPTTGKVNY